ncbi:MAG: DUF6141 family protein [Bacteroidia bacterium]
MNTNYLFTEKQKFTQWWIWLILLSINGMFLYGIYRQIILKEMFGDNPMSDAGLLGMFVITLLISLLFKIMKLETNIDKQGIYVRLFPLHLQFKHFKWEEIDKAYVRKYNPITEFGGWGLRLGFNGKAYNVKGNNGLQLEFKNGKKLLIGTNRAEEMNQIVKKFKN